MSGGRSVIIELEQVEIFEVFPVELWFLSKYTNIGSIWPNH